MGEIHRKHISGAIKEETTKHKLCFVIPEYNSESSTHFAYLTQFIKELTKDFDIFLIIEKGNLPTESFGCSRIELVQSQNKLFRKVRLKIKLLKARYWGYKDFYIHYSFFAAYIASLIGQRVFYWNCGMPWKYKRNIFRDGFERIVYKLITYLVTGTESLKKEYGTHYRIPESRIKVMPNWIDAESFMQPIDKELLKRELNITDQKVLLFVHRLSERKGAQYLPELVEQLKDENTILLIAGDGPLKRSLEEKLNNKNVRFLGAVAHKNISNYFSITDLFIMPSDEEGFPHVLLESMAAEVPYIAFDVGGVREITPPELQQNILNSKDIKNFTEKVKENLHTPILVDFKTWLEQYSLHRTIEVLKSHILT